MIRIETGRASISTADLKALLTQYEVKDDNVVSRLVDLAKNSRRQSWSQYQSVLSPADQEYFGLEEAASRIRQFEGTLVPGLLQTPAYTQALLTGAFDMQPSHADLLMRARQERQERLRSEEPGEMFFIIDEAVVRRPVGGREVIRQQLERLLELGQRSEITIQCMPFEVGAYEGLQGPMVLLEFEDSTAESEDDSDSDDNPDADNFALYLEGRESQTSRHEADLIRTYLDRFFGLEARAASPEETAEKIRDVRDQL